MHSLIHLFVALLYVMSELADRAHGEQVCTACRSVEESAWFGKDYKIVSDSWKKRNIKIQDKCRRFIWGQLSALLY